MSSICVLFVAVIVGQAENPLQQLGDDFQFSKVVWRRDAGGNTTYVRSEWTLNKNAVIGGVSTDKEGKDLVYQAMLFWDPATKQIRSVGVQTDGSVVRGIWEKNGNAWEIEFTSVKKGGQETAGKVRYTFEGPSAVDVEVDGVHAGRLRQATD